jgi:hypothetical protein
MSLIVRSLPLLLLLVASSTYADTSLQELMERDQLRLRSWLSPTDAIVVGQEVSLVVEISTRRWFAGGTRIHHPEIGNLVVLQRDQFATNLSRQEQGQTWVVQQWALELYPQAAATYAVPSLTLELAVNDAEAGIVRGTLYSKPLQFTARVPELLRSVDFWVSTPAFSINDEFDRKLEKLQPGGAFTRTISSSASHVTSMMLPTPQMTAPPGLAIYPDNPILEDRSNRGEAIARRTDRFTYVVEEAGQYQLAEQTFFWWDSVRGEVQTQRLTAVIIDAGTAPTSTAKPASTAGKIRLQLRWIIVGLALSGLIALLRYRHRNPAPLSSRQRLRAASRALQEGDARLASSLLYDWLNSDQPGPDWHSLRSTAGEHPQLVHTIDQLLQSAYGEQPPSTDHMSESNLRALADSGQKKRWRLWPAPVQLKLNPRTGEAHPRTGKPIPGSNSVERKASAPP